MFFMPTTGFEPGSSRQEAAALPSVLSHLVNNTTLIVGVRMGWPNIVSRTGSCIQKSIYDGHALLKAKSITKNAWL